MFARNVVSKNSFQKSNIYERDCQNLFQTEFLLDYFDKDLSNAFQFDQQDVNLSIELLLDNMYSVLDEYSPLIRVNKYKLKFKSKPWITPAIQKSITVKNKLLKKFINTKDSQKKKLFIGNIKITEICYRHF